MSDWSTCRPVLSAAVQIFAIWLPAILYACQLPLTERHGCPTHPKHHWLSDRSVDRVCQPITPYNQSDPKTVPTYLSQTIGSLESVSTWSDWCKVVWLNRCSRNFIHFCKTLVSRWKVGSATASVSLFCISTVLLIGFEIVLGCDSPWSQKCLLKLSERSVMPVPI